MTTSRPKRGTRAATAAAAAEAAAAASATTTPDPAPPTTVVSASDSDSDSNDNDNDNDQASGPAPSRRSTAALLSTHTTTLPLAQPARHVPAPMSPPPAPTSPAQPFPADAPDGQPISLSLSQPQAPQAPRADDSPAQRQRMVITHMVLRDFKSYAGTQTIGPFHKSFTAVVGPNGSGKSNVIDALLFVFGYRASKMRQAKIGQLVHSSEEHPNVRQCCVEVHFCDMLESATTGDPTPLPDSKLVISRTATKSHTSRYFINGQPSNYAAVTTLLQSKGIDLDHNRFLILQGEVESIAQMKPKGTSSSSINADGSTSTSTDDGLLEYLEDIIGTAQFKQPIAQAAAQLDVLQEQRTDKVARVRLVDLELARMADARASAQAYLDKEVRRRQLQARVARYNRARHVQEVAARRGAVDEVQGVMRNLDAGFDADKIKQEQAEVGAQLKAARERHEEARKAVDPLDRQVGELQQRDMQIREERKADKKKREKLGKKRVAADKEIADGQGKLTELTAQVEEMEAERANVAEELGKVREQVDEMQVEVRAKTRDLQAELDALTAEARPWVQQVKEKEEARAAAKSQHDRLVEAVARAERERTRLVAEEARLAGELETLTTAVDELKQVKAERAAKIAELQAKAQALDQSKQEARNHAHVTRVKAEESRRALAQARDSRAGKGSVLDAIKAVRKTHFPGVRDRLGNLATIPRKYDVAVSTAVGMLDHIIVDSVETSQRLFQYLREHNLGRISTLSLDKVPQRDPGSVNTPEGVPRLIDLITLRDPRDRAVVSAFYMAMSDTLVAQDLEQANRIAFPKGNRAGGAQWRVVTLAGDMIDTSGTMAGGGRVSRGRMMLADDATQASQHDDDEQEEQVTEQEVVQCERARDSWQAKLNDVSREADGVAADLDKAQRDLAEVDKALAKTQLAFTSLTGDLERVRAELAEVAAVTGDADATAGSGKSKKRKQQQQQPQQTSQQARVDELAAELAQIDADLVTLRKKTSKFDSAIAAKQAAIDDAGGETYKRAKSQLAQLTATDEQLTKAAAKAQAQLKQTERRMAEAAQVLETTAAEHERLETRLAELAKEMDEITAKAIEVTEQRDLVQVQVDEAQAVVAGLVGRMEELEAKAQKYTDARAKLVATANDLLAKVAESEKQVAGWTAKLAELQEGADATRMALGLPSREEALKAAALAASQRDADGDVVMNEDSAVDEIDVGDVLDDDADDSNEDLDVSAAQHEIRRLGNEISGQQVNLSVLAEYRARQQERAQRSADLAEVEEARDAAKRALDATKRTRLTQFMAGFTEITARLKDMYSLITTGGNAELELVDSMDPFSEGIVFSVMPPRKSWKQIANLSGGERTLASLALVFALQAYRPTPLYVLDEIDAALDFRNVSIIANYVREQSSGPHAAQFIIISLRHNMFELADRLVGIYKTNNCTKSVTINPNEVAAAVGLLDDTDIHKKQQHDAQLQRERTQKAAAMVVDVDSSMVVER